ncbi:MAG: tetratricopeptide repeat protein [Sphingomonas sp.]|uniref:tetratricopeptide repeat protein n=1 Tax=Sphingomonas sp. TaxID=28214 RepID=UPI001AC07ACB|nr:tetratricopeptide repeat protein [Sphingomonas sp.]MBN8806783.1 tetratricopeptide repeat protein [Sphingomonas sp.]
MILLHFALQATAPVADDPRYRSCIELAVNDPKAAIDAAERFRFAGGGARARQCLGLAYAQQSRWVEAANAFTQAAQDADGAKDLLAARYWSQAGNAWLAAGEANKAYDALSTALTAGTLEGQDKGEALLDRARALVAAGRLSAARTDLDVALEAVPADPLAWLLSATLARRTNDMPRAQTDIAQALKLSADDASVQLEAGNIAARGGDVDAAKAAWQQTVRIAPTSPAGQNARAALAQFDDAPAPVPAATVKPATK